MLWDLLSKLIPTVLLHAASPEQTQLSELLQPEPLNGPLLWLKVDAQEVGNPQ